MNRFIDTETRFWGLVKTLRRKRSERIHFEWQGGGLRWRSHGTEVNGRSAVVGIKEVARQAGVSVGTVSNVLNRPERVSSEVRDRREGLVRAVEESGRGRDAIVDIPAERLDVGAGRDAGARLVGLSSRPTAVFCANDLLALGVMQTAFDMGVRVPDDLAIVGYDDIEFAEASLIPMTSVRHPAGEMGRLATELLLREIDPPEPGSEHRHTGIVLKPELVVRRSSMPRP
ncbi:LacI family DNA-binding transcriptional regulator [Streptomyces sp. NPDC006307]|uniref:LacI family DNA-binding transcriptional regulator n=1 Tax=Streptomyces sp. NPDC006307 TaxID=3156748 RepID=UPI0033A87DF9